MDTQRLREEFLVEGLMQCDKIKMVYTHHDRVIVGGAVPVRKELRLDGARWIKADYLLEKREIGIILLSGKGVVRLEDREHEMSTGECLYAGKGTRDVLFINKSGKVPAEFYFASAPAHKQFPVQHAGTNQAKLQELGDRSKSNERAIQKLIHPGGIQSCQLMMGVTDLKPGSNWNTMPPHRHDRRMEVYFYYNLPDNERIWHFMGEPDQTRHLIVQNRQAVISPPWSIHAGAGTTSYSFVWVMAGENQDFSDMDFLEPKDLA